MAHPHHVRRRAILSSLIAAVTLATPAWAQEVPFKISGTGVGPEGFPTVPNDPRRHTAVGTATHLGRYEGEGFLALTSPPTIDLANGTITGEFGSAPTFVFTAADGSELVVRYGRTADALGQFVLTIVERLEGGGLRVEGEFTAEFVVQPELSTGRFAGVTGSWIMVARTEPFVLGSTEPLAYSWEGEGTLTFPRKRPRL